MVKKYLIAFITLLIMTGCSADRNNPHDPGADNYTGGSGKTVTAEVTVTFNYQDGRPDAAIQVTAGGLVPQPSDPVRICYTFNGWFSEAECETLWQFSTETVTSPITIYAGWTAQTCYTVTFDSDGGSFVEPQFVADGGLIVRPPDPTRGSDGLQGWYTASFDEWIFDTNTVTSDMTLTALWYTPDPPPEPVWITFNSMGGSEVDPVQVQPDDPVASPAEPVRDGYIFTGWFTDEECTNPWNFDDMVEYERTFYAGWEL